MTLPQVPFLNVQKLYRRFGPAFPLYLQPTYGDLFTSGVPLLPRVVVALHPDHVYTVLSQHRPPLEKPRLLRRILQASFGDGLFTSRGAAWRQQRKLMQPAFHHGRLNQYAERMVQHTAVMLESWQDGQIISVGAAMHRLTLHIVLDVLFSVGREDMNTAVIHRAINDLGQGLAALSRSTALFLMPPWMPLPALRQKRRGERVLADNVQTLIANRRKITLEESPPDLLTTLLHSQDAETGETMSDQQLQDELITLYIAGHDTTAILLAWAWVLLAQHPTVADALHGELSSVLHGRLPTFADLPNLPLTQAIIKETLRLYPPTAFLFREAVPGLTLSDTPIPPESMIFLFPYVTQRNGRWFENPDAFQPQRWFNGYEKTLPKGAYFPFGIGPRTCIGNGFALMEAQLLLAAIGQRFQMEQLNAAKLGTTATLGFAEPVNMRLHQR